MSINDAPIYDWGAWIDMAPEFDWGNLAEDGEPFIPIDPMTALYKWNGGTDGGFDHEATAFSPAFAYHDSGTSARLLYTATGSSSLLGKSPIAGGAEVAVRFSLELTGYPEWGAPLLHPLTSGGTQAWRMTVGAAGEIVIRDVDNAVALTGPGIPLDQEVRVEAVITATAATLRVYSSRDGDDLLAPEVTAAATFGAVGNFRVGRTGSTPDLPPLYLDDIALVSGADWIGAPGDARPKRDDAPRVAIIGDSLTAMSGANGAYLLTGLNDRKLAAENVYHWGVGGKKIVGADLTGRDSLQNIDDAIVQLGSVDQWIIALGTNDRPSDDATVNAAIDSILAKIDAVAPGSRVTWINLSSLEYAGVDDVRLNGLIEAKAAERPNTYVADWDAHIRAVDGGENPSPYWLSDGVHMTPEGYEIRANFYLDQVVA